MLYILLYFNICFIFFYIFLYLFIHLCLLIVFSPNWDLSYHSFRKEVRKANKYDFFSQGFKHYFIICFYIKRAISLVTIICLTVLMTYLSYDIYTDIYADIRLSVYSFIYKLFKFKLYPASARL